MSGYNNQPIKWSPSQSLGDLRYCDQIIQTTIHTRPWRGVCLFHLHAMAISATLASQFNGHSAATSTALRFGAGCRLMLRSRQLRDAPENDLSLMIVFLLFNANKERLNSPTGRGFKIVLMKDARWQHLGLSWSLHSSSKSQRIQDLRCGNSFKRLRVIQFWGCHASEALKTGCCWGSLGWDCPNLQLPVARIESSVKTPCFSSKFIENPHNIPFLKIMMLQLLHLFQWKNTKQPQPSSPAQVPQPMSCSLWREAGYGDEGEARGSMT